ncbi:MAG TPA: NAD(P)-dependent oxidoreductase [Symbiobacteriaceae bacterium]|nr:NAD(P)-dependent oxidoreductase [Symbiobacteriaceae bacterium]
MIRAGEMLLTGGSGRLGTELRTLLPGMVAPPRAELDVTRPESIEATLDRYRPSVVVHAAAYTNVARAETDRQACWEANVTGTKNLVRMLTSRGVQLVHISTDYVFEGTRGAYREEDPLGPVRNYYALSKLAAEEVVRVLDRHLIIRTSFRPREWPYPVAFSDVYTSQDYVDIIAPKIALLLQRCNEIPYQTLHVATERKSVFELARRRKPDVAPGSKQEAQVLLPDDISLDISRWTELEASWQG